MIKFSTLSVLISVLKKKKIHTSLSFFHRNSHIPRIIFQVYTMLYINGEGGIHYFVLLFTRGETSKARDEILFRSSITKNQTNVHYISLFLFPLPLPSNTAKMIIQHATKSPQIAYRPLIVRSRERLMHFQPSSRYIYGQTYKDR